MIRTSIMNSQSSSDTLPRHGFVARVHQPLRGQAGTGKIVVITGAGAGVGRATATEFARNGCDVALLSRKPERLEHAAAELRRYGVRTLAFPSYASGKCR
jgi:shikimate 5-dehydrogenase